MIGHTGDVVQRLQLILVLLQLARTPLDAQNSQMVQTFVPKCVSVYSTDDIEVAQYANVPRHLYSVFPEQRHRIGGRK